MSDASQVEPVPHHLIPWGPRNMLRHRLRGSESGRCQSVADFVRRPTVTRGAPPRANVAYAPDHFGRTSARPTGSMSPHAPVPCADVRPRMARPALPLRTSGLDRIGQVAPSHEDRQLVRALAGLHRMA